MENIVIKGIITATSKKQKGDFEQEVPTKTAYVTVTESEAKKLQDFGLAKYTSKEDNEDYFIIKFPQNVMVYTPNGLGVKRPELSLIEQDGIETNNFRTPEDKPLALNILKGEHKGNTFYRLQAIRIEEESDIEEIKAENPFGDELAF